MLEHRYGKMWGADGKIRRIPPLTNEEYDAVLAEALEMNPPSGRLTSTDIITMAATELCIRVNPEVAFNMPPLKGPLSRLCSQFDKRLRDIATGVIK